MATKKNAAPTVKFGGVDALKRPGDKRRNIPTAEYQSLMVDEAKRPVRRRVTHASRRTPTTCAPRRNSATATSTRNWCGAARTRRTGATA